MQDEEVHEALRPLFEAAVREPGILESAGLREHTVTLLREAQTQPFFTVNNSAKAALTRKARGQACL